MTQRAIDGPYIYSITTNTTQWSPVFISPQRAELLGKITLNAAKEFNFVLYAYAILPDHIHLLVKKEGNITISVFMKHIKGRFSRRIWGGRIWKPRFYFRIIEDSQHFANTVEYIQYNYRKSGLAGRFGREPYVFLNWPGIRLEL